MIINQLAKFFLSSLIWGMAAATLKLPPLLGYILSGILLGPSLNKHMHPDTIEYIKVIGEFGLLILMFIAGLELQITKFVGNNGEWAKPIFAVFYQILCGFAITMSIWIMPSWLFSNYMFLTLLVVAGLSLIIILSQVGMYIIEYVKYGGYIIGGLLISFVTLLGISINTGFLETNSLFNSQTMFMVSCILALNSTAVALKLLENRDKKNTLLGNSVTSILIAQDLAIIIMLILLESLGGGSLSFINLGLKVFIAVFVLYLVKLLSDYTPSWVSDFFDYLFKVSRELTTLFAITLCFGFAAVAQYAGFSDIYGAFIAGLMLGNIYKHGKYVIHICEPISDILMPMFFMWLGILFNIKEVLDNWFVVLLLGLAIVIFKYFSNSLIIRSVYDQTTGLTRGCVMLASIMLTQMSEFSIVMIGLVAKSITGEGGAYACDLTKVCVITSLSIGSIITVLIKNWFYSQKYIE